MNRIDRVTAILIQLQSRKVVKAQDMADRFRISLRTVYRDIRTLEEAGIPILGEAGVGYSIMDGYRLPPVMFTKEEATAFLTAEKMIEMLTDSSTEEHYKSAMYKVRAVLRSTEKDFLENLDDHISVLKSNRQRHQVMPASGPLQTILKSIAGKNVLNISYFTHHSQQQTERNVEPVGIFYLDSHWHMVAYCRLRKDYRDFRIDRIKKIQTTSELFNPSHPTLKVYLQQVQKERNLFTIVIRVNKEILPYIDDQRYFNGFVSQKEVKDRVEMTFLTSHLEGFARWYIMFGDNADIISPLDLRKKVQLIVSAMAQRLQ
ncbi:MAG TPA: YafY family protein [Chitinophagaceae bacterium]|nr:YafY family protein [Chitinophagaceae bacterium]